MIYYMHVMHRQSLQYGRDMEALASTEMEKKIIKK